MKFEKFKKLDKDMQWNYIQYLQNEKNFQGAFLGNLFTIIISGFALLFMTIGFGSVIGVGMKNLFLISIFLLCTFALGGVLFKPKMDRMTFVVDQMNQKLKLLTKYYFESK